MVVNLWTCCGFLFHGEFIYSMGMNVFHGCEFMDLLWIYSMGSLFIPWECISWL